jgi:CheY-specific phosphatase CheX
MTDKIDPDDLMDMVSHALESIAFMSVTREKRVEQQATEIYTHVPFEGDGLAGHVSVSADAGFARELAAGMLAVTEDEVNESCESLDAVLELTSIVAGQVIAALGSARRELAIGLPEQVEAALADDDPLVRMRSLQGVLEVRVSCAER